MGGFQPSSERGMAARSVIFNSRLPQREESNPMSDTHWRPWLRRIRMNDPTSTHRHASRGLRSTRGWTVCAATLTISHGEKR